MQKTDQPTTQTPLDTHVAAAPMEAKTSMRVLGLVATSLVAFALISVGALDVGTARGLGPRLFGAVLVVLGSLTAAALLGDRRPAWLAWATPVAGILIALMGVVTAAVWFNDAYMYGYVDTRRIAFAGAAVAVGCSMALLSRQHLPHAWPGWLNGSGNPDKSTLDNVKTTLELFGIVGIVVAATTFWYTNMYLPSTAQPTVNVTVDLEAAGQSAVHADVVLTNSSQFRVRVIASRYQVIVQDEGVYDPARAGCVIAAAADGHALDARSSWATMLRRGQGMVLGSGELLTAGAWLEPGEVLTFGLVAPTQGSLTRGHVVSAQAIIDIAKGDVVENGFSWSSPGASPAVVDDAIPSDDPVWPCTVDGRWTAIGSSMWTTSEESFFNRLTRDPVAIWTPWWRTDAGEIVANPVPMHGDVPVERLNDDNVDSKSRAYDRVVHLYGLIRTQAQDELAAP